MRSIFATVCFLILVAAEAFAQSGRGTITGVIADPAGATMPGIAIEAKNVDTGALYNTESTPTGNYAFAELPPGMYGLSISVPGFKPYIRMDIMVQAAQILRVDIALEKGSASDTVEVHKDASLLRTESGQISHSVMSQMMDDLCMNFTYIRNPLYVTPLFPGTFFMAGGFRVNGAPYNTASYRVEGQEVSNPITQAYPTTETVAGMEAVEQLVLQTNNYAAEYGQAGGGLVTIAMKSGTNSFHGSVFECLRNEALDGNQPYVNVRQRSRYSDYGFTLGGPVWIPKVYDGHNKTFFFLSLEWFRDRTPFDMTFTMPTLAYRNGDFRQALTGRQLGTDPLGRPIMEGAIYDPQTEKIVNGLRVRDQFQYQGMLNVIDPARFDPVAKRIQDFIPLPTSAALTNNYRKPWIAHNHLNRPSFKLDHNFSARSKVSFFIQAMTTNQDQYASFNGMFGGDGIPSPITTDTPTRLHQYVYRLNFDHVIAPTMMLHLGVGLHELHFSNLATDSQLDQLKELGLPGAKATIFPSMGAFSTSRGGLGGRGWFGLQATGPFRQSIRRMYKPSASASLTRIKNNHTYKFGAEMRLEGHPNLIVHPANNWYWFDAQQTGLPYTQGYIGGGTVGFPYASFLLGLVNSIGTGDVSHPRLGKSAWAVFAQDTWKMTRKFTLEYGLRWDYQGYYRDTYGRIPNFSPTTPNPSAGGLPGAVIFEGSGPGHCNCDFARVYPYAFGPRLGAAYQITPKTVFRAGGGISYGQTASENSISQAINPLYYYPSTSYGDPIGLLRNGPPPTPSWPNLDPGQWPFANAPWPSPPAIDHNAGRPPRIIQWSFGVQREISRNLAIEAAYVGNRGVWWEAKDLINVNALTPERIAKAGLDINNAADRTLLSSRLDSSVAAQRGFNKPPYPGFPMSSTVAQALRPFPQFGQINYFGAPLGKTWYDSLQIKAIQRLSHGLSFTGAFTWAKELMMGAEGVGMMSPFCFYGSHISSAAVNDVFNRPMNKYISSLSRPIVFAMMANYTIPKLGLNKALSWAIRDWMIGASAVYASGQPIAAPIAQNGLYSLLFRNTFANRVPGQPLWTKDINCHSCFDPNKDFVLNPKAWVDPPAGQFGTGAAYYDDYRQQRRPMEYVSVGRIFRIGERVALSIRADFQNIFNRTFPNDPSSTNAKAAQNRDANGKPTGGFGYISTTSVYMAARQGMIVARLRF